MVVKLLPPEAHRGVGHPHVPEAAEGPAQGFGLLVPDFVHLGHIAGDGVVISVRGPGQGLGVVQVQALHQVLEPLVEVDGAPVDLPEGLELVHLREKGSVGCVLQPVPGSVHVAQADLPRRVGPSGPEVLSLLLPELLSGKEDGDDLPEVREKGPVVRGEGQLGRRGPHVGHLDEEVVRVHHGAFALPREEPLRIDGEILVQGQVVQQQDHRRAPVLPPRPSRLLPEGSPGAGEPHEHGRVDPPDVDSQLQHVGGHEAPQPARRHFLLDVPPLQGPVSSPIAGDQGGHVPPSGLRG
ncbi:hypothetical protein SDC9_94916 [bioreactor metagenome]|uniref:Uncharacterized protein n=1 Tax=bioreactor metagenome TaxID=1076179 RepID=A0A645A537_9ZZZZ